MRLDLSCLANLRLKAGTLITFVRDLQATFIPATPLTLDEPATDHGIYLKSSSVREAA